MSIIYVLFVFHYQSLMRASELYSSCGDINVLRVTETLIGTRTISVSNQYVNLGDLESI